MSYKRLRVENLKKNFESLRALSTCYKRSKAGHGTCPQRPTGPQIIVQAELEIWVPTFVETPAAAFDPTGYELPVLIRGSDHLGFVQQRLVGGNQYCAGQDVLYQKWVRAVDSFLVADGSSY